MDFTSSTACDVLKGAEAIAEFLLGDASQRRTIYHLVEKSRLPVFRLGTTLCARRSTLLSWMAEQERSTLLKTEAA